MWQPAQRESPSALHTKKSTFLDIADYTCSMFLKQPYRKDAAKMRNHKLIYYAIGVLCFFALSATVPSICSGSPPFSMQVSGIRIVKDGYQDEWELRPFGWDVGTSLTCLLICNEGHIIALDPTRSKIEKLEDNLGTDLSIVPARDNKSLGLFNPISKDRKALTFTISSRHLPKNGATSIKTSGFITAKICDEINTVKHDNVLLKRGTKLNNPDFTINISGAKKMPFLDYPLRVTFQSMQDLSAIAFIQFRGPDGTVIESALSGSGKTFIGYQMGYFAEYELSKHVKKVDIVFIYLKGVREIKFPFSVETSIGL